MKILIVEDEPIIALDLEDIVLAQVDADVVHAASLREALDKLDDDIDFALLDLSLGDRGETSLPLAHELLRRTIPFCFVSSSLDRLPATFVEIPKVSKPFRPQQVADLVLQAA